MAIRELVLELSARQRAILRLAVTATSRDTRRNGGWFKPRDIGGSCSSYHSQGLRRLVAKGYVEHRERELRGAKANGGRARMYRATERGMAYVAGQ